MAKKKIKEKNLQELVEKIEGLPVNQRLQSHLEWIYQLFTKKRQNRSRENIKLRILRIADDIRLWQLHKAISDVINGIGPEESIRNLSKLASEIFNRYEPKPKAEGGPIDPEIGGIVELPRKLDKELEYEKAKRVSQEEDLEANT